MPHIEHYKIGKVEVPSTTDITSLYPKPWLLPWVKREALKWAELHQHQDVGLVDFVKACLHRHNIIRETSAQFGNKVHEFFDNFMRGMPIEELALDEEMAPFLESLVKWKNEGGYEPVAIEPHYESRAHMYHGSPDLIVKKDGELWVVDYKVRKEVGHDVWMQLASYAMLWNENNNHEPITKGMVLLFNPQTGELRKILMQENLTLFVDPFLHLREVYDFYNRKGKWSWLRKRS